MDQFYNPINEEELLRQYGGWYGGHHHGQHHGHHFGHHHFYPYPIFWGYGSPYGGFGGYGGWGSPSPGYNWGYGPGYWGQW
mgnify:CR=1 FL=1